MTTNIYFNSLAINTNIVPGVALSVNGDITIKALGNIFFDENNNSGFRDNNGIMEYKSLTDTQWNQLKLVLNGYVNFDPDHSGSSGYGIRDNNGTIEIKNFGGNWIPLTIIMANAPGNGQLLYTNVSNWKGGEKKQFNLTTAMTQIGKAHFEILELDKNLSNQISDKWIINPSDVLFSLKNYNNNRGTITLSNTTDYIIISLSNSDVWTLDDVYKQISGNSGIAILLSLLTTKKMLARVTTPFASTTVTTWTLNSGILDEDGAFKMVSHMFQSVYKINSNQALSWQIMKNMSFITANTTSDVNITTGYHIANYRKYVNTFNSGNTTGSPASTFPFSLGYNQSYYLPSICVDPNTNMIFAHTFMRPYVYSVTGSAIRGSMVNNYLTNIKDAQIGKYLYGSSSNFVFADTPCSSYTNSYCPTMITANGKIFLMANQIRTIATTTLTASPTSGWFAALNIYTNKMARDTSYTAVRRAFNALLTGTTYRLLYAKIFKGGNNTLWVCGLCYDGTYVKYVYCVSADFGATWTTATGTTVTAATVEVVMTSVLNPTLSNFQNAIMPTFYQQYNPGSAFDTILPNTTTLTGTHTGMSALTGTAFSSYYVSGTCGQNISGAYDNIAVCNFFPSGNDTYAVFSSTTTTLTNRQIFYALFTNSTITATSSTSNLISNESGFSSYNQHSPYGIVDNNGRVIFVWVGRNSAVDTNFYVFYNIMTISNSTLAGSKQTDIIFASYTTNTINLLKKSNGDIHMVIGLPGGVVQYCLYNNSGVFSPIVTIRDNYKYQLLTNKYGSTLNGFNVSCDLYGDKIVGLGMFSAPSLMKLADFSNLTNQTANFGSANTQVVPLFPYYFSEHTTLYEWNPYKRIHADHPNYNGYDQLYSVLKIYNNVFYLVSSGISSLYNGYKIYFQTSNNLGQTWSTPIMVSNNTSSFADITPDMCIDTAGKIHIVYAATSSYDSVNNQIFYCNSTNNGTSFTIPVNISQLVGFVQTNPKIVVSNTTNNNIFIVWSGNNSIATINKSRIYVATSTNNGTSWTYDQAAPLTDGTFMDYDQDQAVACYSNGKLYIAWRGFSSSMSANSAIFTAYSDDNGATYTKFETVYIQPTVSINIHNFNYGVDINDNIHIVMQLSNRAIYVTNSPNLGLSWITPKRIDNQFTTVLPSASHAAYNFSVACTEDGKAHIFYRDFIMSECYPVSGGYTSDVCNFMHIIYSNGVYNPPEALVTTPFKLYDSITGAMTFNMASLTNTKGYGMDDYTITVDYHNGNLYAVVGAIYAGMFETSLNARISLNLFEYTPHNVNFGISDDVPLGSAYFGAGDLTKNANNPSIITLLNGTIYGAIEVISDTTTGVRLIYGTYSINSGDSWYYSLISVTNMGQNFSPYLYQSPNGKLYCVWYASNVGIGGNETRILYAYSNDNGINWSTHYVIDNSNAEATISQSLPSMTSDINDNLYFTYISENQEIYVVKINDVDQSFISRVSITKVMYSGNNTLLRPIIKYHNGIIFLIFAGATTLFTTNRQLYYTTSTNGVTWSNIEFITNTATLKLNAIGGFDYVVDSSMNIHLIGSTTVTQTVSGGILFYTYKNYSDLSTSWISNLQMDVTPDLGSGKSSANIGDYHPSLCLNNNVLYVACYGKHWNNMYQQIYPFTKIYKKPLTSGSKFFLNKYMPNLDAKFNTTTDITNYVVNSATPAITIDNDGIVHVLHNMQSTYNISGANGLRPFYFRSIDQKAVKTNSYVSAVTNANGGDISANNWTNLVRTYLYENSNNTSSYYSICFENAGFETWYVFSGVSSRKIVVYDKTNLTYKINSNNATFISETLTDPVSSLPSGLDQALITVLEEAMDYSFNRMNGLTLNNFRSFPSTTDIANIRLASILTTDNQSFNPQVNSILVEYTANAAYIRKTPSYIIEIKDVNTIQITPPEDNTTRNSLIYVSDGSSVNPSFTSIYAQFETSQDITQALTTSYSIIDLNSGALLTKTFGGSNFSISSNSIAINTNGYYSIEIVFDISSDVAAANNISFSIDSVNTLAVKTVNITNLLDRMIINYTLPVTSAPTTYSLYMKSSIACNVTIANLIIINEKMYTQV